VDGREGLVKERGRRKMREQERERRGKPEKPLDCWGKGVNALET